MRSLSDLSVLKPSTCTFICILFSLGRMKGALHLLNFITSRAPPEPFRRARGVCESSCRLQFPRLSDCFSLSVLCPLSLYLSSSCELTNYTFYFALADCTVCVCVRARLREGLCLVHVQSGSTYPPLLQRLRQGLLVHQASPRGVDQERALTHLRRNGERRRINREQQQQQAIY